MIFAYGSTAFPEGSVDLSIVRAPIEGEQGVRRGTKITWNLSGQIEAADQASLTTAIQALEAAFDTNGRDAILYLPDGVTPTAHQLLNAGSSTGVKVVKLPSYPTGQGAEYSTFRTWTAVLEAEYEDENPDQDEVSFVETVSTIGTGGPAFVIRQGVRRAHKQQLFDKTPVRATQSGSATGKTRYPAPPPPIWPSAEKVEQRQVTRKTPKRGGTPGQPTYTDWEINWTYTFESTDPLTNDPNRLPF